MKQFAISLALGDIYGNSGNGKLKEPLDGAIARFKAGVSALPHDVDTAIICTAGYSKKEPRIPQPERLVSLAGQLERYVSKHYLFTHIKVVTKPICWSTRNEVRIGIKVAQRLGYVRKEDEVDVIIASNFTHLFRIWLYAKLYTPRNWRFVPVRAKHQFSFVSHVLELPKIVRDLHYSAKVLLRLRRLKRHNTPQ